MKSLVFLVLLLFLFERSVQEVEGKPQRQDDVQENESDERQVSEKYCDVCSELKELRDMVIEQRLGMQILKDKLSEQAAELSSTKTELLRVTSELETVRRENSAQSSQLTEFESRMVLVEKTLEEDAEQNKVAFSVGLTDSGGVGPFNPETTLVYEKIFYNHGQAYNPITGIFTAPKKGAYYFRFTGFDYRSVSTGLNMYHNQKQVLHVGTYPDGKNFYYSNAIVLEMEEGDLVYMKIPANYYLYDNSNNACTFTGFLLFPL